MQRRTVLLAGSALLTTVLAGCTDSKAPTRDPQEVLRAAREKLVAAGTVAVTLTGPEIPAGRNGVVDATGDGQFSSTEPKFSGTVSGRVNDVSANLEIVAVGEKAWWKFFTPDFTPADLAAAGAPNPSTFFDPESGIPALLTQAKDVKAGRQAREGKDILTEYTGTIPGSLVKDLLFLGDGAADFAATLGITAGDELRKAVLTGAFYEGTTGTYTLVLTDYGKPVTITAPQ